MPKETTLFEREVPEATLLWKYASEQRGHYNTPKRDTQKLNVK